MWALTEDKLPKWFVNQATVIDVDIRSEKLVKLPRPAPSTGLKLEESVKISKTRQCLAYTLRLKHEGEEKNLEGQEEAKTKPKLKKRMSIEDDGPLQTTGQGLLIIPELTEITFYDDFALPAGKLEPASVELFESRKASHIEGHSPLRKLSSLPAVASGEPGTSLAAEGISGLKTEKKNWLPMKALEYAGPLMKSGRKTKIWITRWHVVSNHTMYIYDSDSAKEPKRKDLFESNNGTHHFYRHRLPSRAVLPKVQREEQDRHPLILRHEQLQGEMDVPQ